MRDNIRTLVEDFVFAFLVTAAVATPFLVLALTLND